MARPKKKEPKTRRITIRVTETEYAIFTEEAEKQKMTLAEYIRQRVIHHKTETKYEITTGKEELKELLIEHHKIGINLNQIAKHLNAGGTATPELIKDIHRATAALCHSE